MRNRVAPAEFTLGVDGFEERAPWIIDIRFIHVDRITFRTRKRARLDRQQRCRGPGNTSHKEPGDWLLTVPWLRIVMSVKLASGIGIRQRWCELR